MTESKLVYNDGRTVRALRGVVTFDGPFAVVTRRDGTSRIAESQVIEIVTFRDDATVTRDAYERDECDIWVTARSHGLNPEAPGGEGPFSGRTGGTRVLRHGRLRGEGYRR